MPTSLENRPFWVFPSKQTPGLLPSYRSCFMKMHRKLVHSKQVSTFCSSRQMNWEGRKPWFKLVNESKSVEGRAGIKNWMEAGSGETLLSFRVKFQLDWPYFGTFQLLNINRLEFEFSLLLIAVNSFSADSVYLPSKEWNPLFVYSHLAFWDSLCSTRKYCQS